MKLPKKIVILIILVLPYMKGKSSPIINIKNLYTMHFSIMENVPVQNYKSLNRDMFLVYSIHLLMDSGYTIKQIYQNVYKNIIEQSCNDKSDNKYIYSYEHYGTPFTKIGTYTTRITKSSYCITPNKILNIDDMQICVYPTVNLNKIRLPKRILEFNKSDESTIHKRIASIIKIYWWVVNYSPYRTNKAIDETFDILLLRVINEKLNITLNEYLNLMDKFIATFNDSHSSFSFGKYALWGIVYRYKPVYYAPILLNNLNGNVICIQTDTTLIKGISKGDTIIKANGLPVDTFINLRYEYISCKPQSKKDYLVYDRLFSSYVLMDSFNVELNNRKHVNISCSYNQPMELVDTLSYLTYINDSTLLINSKANKLKLSKVVKELKNTKIKSIHIDVETYPDYKLIQLLPFIFTDSIKSPDFIVKKINSNGIYTYDTSNWSIYPKLQDRKYEIYLHHFNAISYGETIVEIFKYYDIGKIVGNTTVGTNGDVVCIDVPLGRFCSTGIIVSRNGQLHDCIEPDIYQYSSH